MALAKCTNPPSERTHGELSDEMMTCFVCFRLWFVSTKRAREEAYVERFSETIGDSVEESTPSRFGVDEVYRREGFTLL